MFRYGYFIFAVVSRACPWCEQDFIAVCHCVLCQS